MELVRLHRGVEYARQRCIIWVSVLTVGHASLIIQCNINDASLILHYSPALQSVLTVSDASLILQCNITILASTAECAHRW